MKTHAKTQQKCNHTDHKNTKAAHRNLDRHKSNTLPWQKCHDPPLAGSGGRTTAEKTTYEEIENAFRKKEKGD